MNIAPDLCGRERQHSPAPASSCPKIMSEEIALAFEYFESTEGRESSSSTIARLRHAESGQMHCHHCCKVSHQIARWCEGFCGNHRLRSRPPAGTAEPGFELWKACNRKQ